MERKWIWIIVFLVLIPVVTAGYIIYNETVSCKIGEDCNKDIPDVCEDGYVFSEKDCECVFDPSGCKGLDKETCEQNPDCFSFSRSGTCSCPICEIYLSHQCLPR